MHLWAVSTDRILSHFQEAAKVLESFLNDPSNIVAVEQAAAFMSYCLKQGSKIISCGNGGSMADAMHVAEEFSGRFRHDREPLPAIALSDPAHMSCVANDYGYDQVFSRQVKALGKAEDILVLLSTSGNSPNLAAAAREALRVGMTVVSALGRGGGELADLSNLVLMVPGDGSDRIQELHMLAFHAIIEDVENRWCAQNPSRIS